MAWEALTTKDEGRGLLTLIPDEGYAGWVCYFNGDDRDEDVPRYGCKNVLIPVETIWSFETPPNLLWESQYDVEEVGFRCTVTKKGLFDDAKCLMPLPVESDSYLRGEYRWNPNDRTLTEITQIGYVASRDITQNSWVNLGVVQFMGGFNGLTVSIATMIVGFLTMSAI